MGVIKRNWDDPPSRVFTTKKTQLKDWSFKTPKLPDKLNGFEETQRGSQRASNSSLLSEWTVNQVFLGWKTFHSQQNTKAKLLAHCVYAFLCWHTAYIILAAVWHLPDWNPGDKTTARFGRWRNPVYDASTIKLPYLTPLGKHKLITLSC